MLLDFYGRLCALIHGFDERHALDHLLGPRKPDFDGL